MKPVCLLSTIIVVVLLTPVLLAGQPSVHEKEVWSLEDAYWQYVKANDFEHYLTLWHPDFLGWPYSSPEPAGKDQITEWITAHTGKGETLKSYELERLKARAIGDYVTVTYRAHLIWTDKNGADKPRSLRVIHTGENRFREVMVNIQSMPQFVRQSGMNKHML